MTGFDREELIAACCRHGRVARVVVAQVRGSAPREIGAAMLVWKDGFSGTIGGGTLEYQAMQDARANLLECGSRRSNHALGPDLGQCCGGTVVLITQVFDRTMAEALPFDLVCSGKGEMPFSVRRLLAAARGTGYKPKPILVDDWFVEPVAQSIRDLWIWGAGHVGRALVDTCAPLPNFSITWVDIHRDRFPSGADDRAEIVMADKPEALVAYAPKTAEHMIVTYSHALDLALCHQLLLHGFGFAGLIGSKTKWARFRKRLAALGHQSEAIAQITCPIGQPSLGKHPHVIAVGVAAQLLDLPRLSPVRLEEHA